MRIQLWACMLLIALVNKSAAQKFSAKGEQIWDYNQSYQPQEFFVEVYGLPNKIDDSYGIERAEINIRHNRSSDLKITLESPDGTAIWLSNRNGGDNGKNYTQSQFSNDADLYIHQAKAPFTGIFKADGRMEYFNNGQNPNGFWKVIVEDLKASINGELDTFSITFSNHPARLIAEKRCAFETPELCVCKNGKKSGVILPDLIILPSFTRSQVKEYAWNDSIYPGQLRFAATIANIGYGPMEIRGVDEWYCDNNRETGNVKCADGENSRQQIIQRVYKLANGKMTWNDLKAGTMYLEEKPGHNHYHVDNWVEFRLLKRGKNKKPFSVSNGSKVSYCLFTSGICYDGDNICSFNKKMYGQQMPNYGLGNYVSCNTGVQGISVGGYDTYGMMYEGQFLQLPGNLENGEYILEIEIDPDHKYYESNKKNNTFSMPITISKQQKIH